jgi:hypothetical protein
MNDFTAELARLHELSGGNYSRQVERIALRKEFHPLDTDKYIFTHSSSTSRDSMKDKNHPYTGWFLKWSSTVLSCS